MTLAMEVVVVMGMGVLVVMGAANHIVMQMHSMLSFFDFSSLKYRKALMSKHLFLPKGLAKK